MFRHILPNSIGPLVVSIAFTIPGKIIAEAVLGYLGLGLRPGTDPKEFFVTSWGALLAARTDGVECPAVAVARSGDLCGAGGDGVHVRRRRPARRARSAYARHVLTGLIGFSSVSQTPGSRVSPGV